MIQSRGRTYRIIEVRGTYDAIRIADDVRIGAFRTMPRLTLDAVGVDDAELRAVATMAIMQGKVLST